MASNHSFQFWEFIDNKDMFLSFPLISFYITSVLAIRYFSPHRSLSLRPVLFIYNLITTIWSIITTYMFFMTLYTGWTGSLQNDFFLLAMKIFWLAKIFELMDTFFMLFRRKYEQLSLLHLYHHSSMVILMEWFYKFYPMTQIAFPSFVNSLVHVLMYTYYALNSLNIHCPWKKYLTQLQLFQFAILIIHGVVGVFINKEWPFWLYIAYELSMMACFWNFYQKTYNDRNRTTTTNNGDDTQKPMQATMDTDSQKDKTPKSNKRLESNPTHKRVKSD